MWHYVGICDFMFLFVLKKEKCIDIKIFLRTIISDRNPIAHNKYLYKNLHLINKKTIHQTFLRLIT